jgi:hypothetical protein
MGTFCEGIEGSHAEQRRAGRPESIYGEKNACMES